MEKPIPVEAGKAYLLLNHGPVTLVSSAHAGRRNVMAASWAMPLDFVPPKVAVVIDRSTLTRELVEASGEFVLNIPTRRMARQVLQCGTHGGRDLDKFTAFGLSGEAGSASAVAAPLVAGCVGWLECRVIAEPAIQGRYDLFLGEVLAAWADPRHFSDGRWHFADADGRTIHYSAGGRFFATGDAFEA
jgi:flavin reductase (DIM6/NTAB) family NADH-FMN oxidoreductase RutF